MDIKKIFKKIVEILLIVTLCVAVTRFFINKEQKQKKNIAVSQESSGKEKSDKNYAQYKNNKKSNKKKKKEYNTETNNNNQNSDSEKTISSGNRKYKIDYDHIIGGDINSSGEKVTGGHTLLRGDVRILKKIGSPASNGVYRATVEIKRPDGKWQKKTSNGGVNTMFPENWDEARVIDEINSAWENRKELKGRDSNMWQGISKSGVIIRGYKSPRITAYPIYEGER
ncbi:MAG: EndoU domain-containing protein [Pseudoleptotrichia goodfellowii]|nr:EndoU domain-containing protein [Pseudoleptotrichia goodfellowii]